MSKNISNNLISNSYKTSARVPTKNVLKNLRITRASNIKQENVDSSKINKPIEKSLKIKRCVVKVPRIPLQDKNSVSRASPKHMTPLQDNSKRYYIKYNLGDVSFSVKDSKAKEVIKSIETENKENKKECTDFGFEQSSLRSGKVISSLKNKGNENKSDVYEFDSDNNDSGQDKNTTSDVIEKIIKEGKASLVKYKSCDNYKQRKSRSKSVPEILKRIRRNLLTTNFQFMKKEQNETIKEKDSNLNEISNEIANAPFDENAENLHIDNEVKNSQDNLHYSQNIDNQLDYEKSALEKSTKKINPNKKIEVLEVIHLPQRATAATSTARTRSLEKHYSFEDKKQGTVSKLSLEKNYSFKNTEFDDIRNATYLDFLAQLDGTELPSAVDDSFIHQLDDTTIEQESVRVDKKYVTNSNSTVLKEKSISPRSAEEKEETLNDSIFPDVNVTPHFDTTLKRKTYSGLKKKEKRTHHFILFSATEDDQDNVNPLTTSEKVQESLIKDSSHTEAMDEKIANIEEKQSRSIDKTKNKENRPVRKKRKLQISSDLNKSSGSGSNNRIKFEKRENDVITPKKSRFLRF